MRQGPDSSVWEREFCRRFESVRGSLRSLQLDIERERAAKNNSTLKRLEHYVGLINEAFAVLNRPKPIRESADEKSTRQALSLSEQLKGGVRT